MAATFPLPTAQSATSVILVTGGCGYIGSHFVVQLLETGYGVVVVDDLSNSTTESIRRAETIAQRAILSFYQVSVCDTNALRRVFELYEFDAVIHFAGLKSVAESVSDPLSYYSGNVGGMVSLMSVMKEFGVFKLVFSSSATVYGHPHYLPIDESHPLTPTNPYGHSKLMCEQVARDMCRSDPRFKVALLRYFNPIGAHSSALIGESPLSTPNNLLPCITQVLASRLPALRVFGTDWPTHDGTGVRDFVHVVDLASAHLRAVRVLGQVDGQRRKEAKEAKKAKEAKEAKEPKEKEKDGNCFTWNIGTGQGYSVMQIVRAAESASRKTVPLVLSPPRPGDCAHVVANPSLANSQLRWSPKFGVDEMVRSAWEFQKWNPEGYNAGVDLLPVTRGASDNYAPVVLSICANDDTTPTRVCSNLLGLFSYSNAHKRTKSCTEVSISGTTSYSASAFGDDEEEDGAAKKVFGLSTRMLGV
ncbi:UDP-glucose 4-epimerase [Gonapodya prolifera JEL478]|uniref:UDP-glucose 4-epimerase n=1 Tax=Gonapodya prolifera (strain JEL478) TaxID=1344416 RepID=A0A138ZXQ0_GONPJ|nr:UDP-glucose 4-epimerase [Gonapodya prolifera JEL478]|eukprot:KXS09075.1 UDP-glucose 4-epimerase [Gonapodya prolifera JEL478]